MSSTRSAVARGSTALLTRRITRPIAAAGAAGWPAAPPPLRRLSGPAHRNRARERSHRPGCRLRCRPRVWPARPRRRRRTEFHRWCRQVSPTMCRLHQEQTPQQVRARAARRWRWCGGAWRRGWRGWRHSSLGGLLSRRLRALGSLAGLFSGRLFSGRLLCRLLEPWRSLGGTFLGGRLLIRCGWIGGRRGGVARLVRSILLVCHGAAPSQFLAGYPSCQRPPRGPTRSPRVPPPTSTRRPSAQARRQTGSAKSRRSPGACVRRAANRCDCAKPARPAR